MSLKKGHGSLSPKRELANRKDSFSKKTIELDLGAMFKSRVDLSKENRLDSLVKLKSDETPQKIYFGGVD